MSIYKNKIPQIRIVVTDYCDKKCFYCRPSGEAITKSNKHEILTTKEILTIVESLSLNGVSIVRITGGEPLLHPDIFEIIKKIKRIKEVSLVTRSKDLKNKAIYLKEAGLDSITVSIDSLNKVKSKDILGVDILDDLIDGVNACYKLKIPIKINTVIMKGINDSPNDLFPFIEFAGKYGPADWKLLDFMVLPNQYTKIDKTFFVNLSEIKKTLKNIGVSNKDEFSVQAGGLGSPMLKIKMKNGVNVFIKDSTVGSHYAAFCETCKYFPCQDAIMALRLTPNGDLQKCLYRENNLVSLKPILNDSVLLNKVSKEIIEQYKNSKFIKNAWQIKQG